MTTHINLLDWRKARREKRKQDFIASIGLGVAVAGGLVAAGWMLVSGQLSYQESRNAYLRAEIKEMDKQLTEIQELERVRSNLIARMRVIEELEASRTASVHFFDEIVNTLPEGVNLTSLRQQGANVTLDGIAESNGRISTYMKNLDASPWFSDPRLVVIKTDEKDQRRQAQFTLQVKRLTQPKSADNAPADAEGEEVVG
ncbi:PilN domain-containing protein [Sinimarinibacterium flocculans]|jgi:type IV pilus assembly protein PilN|uniref:Type IV pilus assembly protein PilN n=1 Tax=Sinimarinibacterium flocculans TaxID=985250 RepID=A0A318EBM8_9GAMM|nr:PilN domain-containing protein [Sinimarinibacterium flocculans]PXV64859.1 type IV pilus assembly protein PilN [Sinimarinibacterium flocculans]